MAKKRGKRVQTEDQVEIFKEFGDFADLVTENEARLDSEDSFENYAHQLRSHLHMNKNAFKNNFSEGYILLLEELKKQSI